MRFAIALTLALVGCGQPATPAERVRDDLAVMQQEHAADKLVQRGRAFASVGDATRGEQYLSAALDAGGDPAAILPELLRVCVGAQRYRVAIAYADPWLARRPHDRNLRFVVAALKASIGDAVGARSEFERLLLEEPDEARVRFAYAVLLRDQLADPGRADAQFRAYLQLDPHGVHAEEARGALLEGLP